MSDFNLILDLFENNLEINNGIYIQTLKIGEKAPVVVHKKTAQLTYVLKGKGIAVIDGKAIKISRGQRIDIMMNQTHSFFATNEDLLLFHVHIPYYTVEEDRLVLQEDINLNRQIDMMENVIIWDDRYLFNNLNDDSLIKNKFEKINSVCSYHVVDKFESDLWLKKIKGPHQSYVISIGTRPQMVGNVDLSIMPKRIKNDNGQCVDVVLSIGDETALQNINDNVKKITILEDFVVEGKTLSKIISMIRKHTMVPIEIIVLGGLQQAINTLKSKYDYLKFTICGKVVSGIPIEDATVLFVSDLLRDNKKMLKNRQLMIRCFPDCYDTVLDIFHDIKGLNN